MTPIFINYQKRAISMHIRLQEAKSIALFICYSYRYNIKEKQQKYVLMEDCKRQLGEGNGTPLQDSCLENPMDGGAWWAAVHEVVKSQT